LDTSGRGGITGACGAQQVPGLVAELVEVGSGRKVWHDVSFFKPAVPHARPPKEIATIVFMNRRWTQSCPRTRRRPLTPRMRVNHRGPARPETAPWLGLGRPTFRLSQIEGRMAAWLPPGYGHKLRSAALVLAGFAGTLGHISVGHHPV